MAKRNPISTRPNRPTGMVYRGSNTVMKGYSWSKEDFRDLLIKKYNMKVKDTDLVLISSADCSRCFYLRDKLEEWCNKNGYRFREEPYSSKMTEITSVPSAIIGKDVILNYDAIMEMITSKKSFY